MDGAWRGYTLVDRGISRNTMSGEEPRVMTEEEEEDDFFTRMCEAAISDDVDEVTTEEQSMSVDNEEELDEESYFARLSAQSSSLVLEEQSLVWQSLLRQSAGGEDLTSSLGQRNTKLVLVGQGATSSLLMLQQFLFSQLPKSSMMFSNVNRMLAKQADQDKEWSLYCDHVNHPSLIVLIAVYSSGVLESDMSLSVFSSMPLSIDLAQQVASVVVAFKRNRKIGSGDGQAAAGEQKVTLQGLDAWSCKESLLHALTKGGLRAQWTEPANLWCLLDALTPASVPSSDLGVDLLPLSIEDAPIVNDKWKYKSNYSITAVRGLIASGLPCLGARCRATGRLVGWVLTQPYGAIGMLFTMPEHRGRGVARLLIRILLGLWLKHEPPFQCAPFCYITPDNDASMAAFRALGFSKMADQEWVGLSFA